MNKFGIILTHTYIEKIKSKTFIITTALMLLFIIGGANYQSIFAFFSDDEKSELAVIDQSGVLYEPLKLGLETDNLEVVSYDGTEKEALSAVEEDDYIALVVTTLNQDGLPEATYYANNISDSMTQNAIKEQLQQIKVALAIEQEGLDAATIQAIYADVQFEVIAIDEAAKSMEEIFQAQGIVYVMVFFMYIVVIMYGQMIAQDVANEKSSRVMELLISSASPVSHMFAKIFGVGLVGLTQIALVIAVSYFMINQKRDELVGEALDAFGLLDIPMDLVIYAIVFFLLGYTLYATLAAMLGSLVSRAEDVGQLITPMVILIVIAFLIAMFGLAAPESTIVTVSSFIPFFTPMVMILRIGMLDVPLWEVGLSIGILIVTIIIFGLIGARVYKGGVLMYGRSGSLKDLKKAIRLSKNEK